MSTKDSLISFDDNSPLFVKKKTTGKKRKPKKVLPDNILNILNMGSSDELVEPIKESPKPRKKLAKKVVSTNPNIPKYSISGPSSCKHILPAFKKMLNAKWKILEDGSYSQCMDVAGWIRGISNYLRYSRPKEHEELKLLYLLAKGKAEDKY